MKVAMERDEAEDGPGKAGTKKIPKQKKGGGAQGAEKPKEAAKKKVGERSASALPKSRR